MPVERLLKMTSFPSRAISLLLCVTLLLTTTEAAFVIDKQSCGPTDSVRNNNLRKQLKSAFSMIQNTNNKLPRTFQEFDANANPNFKNLFDQLFNHVSADYGLVKSKKLRRLLSLTYYLRSYTDLSGRSFPRS